MFLISGVINSQKKRQFLTQGKILNMKLEKYFKNFSPGKKHGLIGHFQLVLNEFCGKQKCFLLVFICKKLFKKL